MHAVVLIISLSWMCASAQGPCNSPPKCTGPHEVRTNCYNPCAKTCYTRFRDGGLACTSAAVCRKGCICEPGYLRHDNGTCVEEYYCSPPICNDDEVYNACGTCETSCDTLNNTCLSCIAACIPGCYCKKGTIRGPDGITCVKPSQCPKKVCGKNEVFNKCPPQCPSGNCSDLWTDYTCENAPDCCEPKCVCRKGYMRNNKGICITGDQCIKTGGN